MVEIKLMLTDEEIALIKGISTTLDNIYPDLSEKISTAISKAEK